jgi:dTDP-3-amino-3,4,6-trideoxy-alpha-D-glucose transaminase
MRIPLTNLRPALDATEPGWRENMQRLFADSMFILGSQLAAFEREFAAATRARFAVGTGNGTEAIQLALRDAGANGDVFTTALTAPFTAVAVRAAGCRPRFADVDPDTLQMDPADLDKRLTKRAAAIVAVHLYGQPCDLTSIAAIARANRAVLVQDACQAHGAVFRGRALTGWSRYVCYSFYPTKNLGCLGDGGAICTDRKTLAGRLAKERDGGRGRRPQIASTWGINSRLDELQCCFLRAFLVKLEEWNRSRARLAALYDEALASCPGVRVPFRSPESVHHLYVIRAKQRDRLRDHLLRLGIGTGVHYPAPLHLHPAFRDCGLKRGDLPNVERACTEVLSLPLWPYLGESAVAEVADRVQEFYRH